ncbi:hypothetical protein BKA82DRAFT_2655048 [Pisolithus tinctorius]|nr:hypothetical protein BKA82DRAFT_2655048 [Pisolithus tinctorius]
MQHQKAKHFKCGMCPRRLKYRRWSCSSHPASAQTRTRKVRSRVPISPSILLIRLSLPRIENALPGRDGYEVEIFGMEGIPAPDVADYKRRREIELGLAAGSISQPQPKRPKIDSRPLSEDELRAQFGSPQGTHGCIERCTGCCSCSRGNCCSLQRRSDRIRCTTCSYSWRHPSRCFAASWASRHFFATVHARCSPSRTFPGRPSNGFSIPWHARIPSWPSTPWLSYTASGSAAATWNASPRCTIIPSWCFPSASSAAHLRACELIFASRAYEWDACFSFHLQGLCLPQPQHHSHRRCSSHRHLYFLILLSSKSMDLSRRRPA